MTRAVRRTKLACAVALASVLAQGCGGEGGPGASLAATGTLTVGDERIELGHATLDATRTGLILTLTDRPLPDHCTGALSALALFEADQRFSAVDIFIPYDPEPAEIQVMVHPTIEYLSGRNVFGETHAIEYGEGVAQGVVEETGEHEGQSISVAVAFEVPLDPTTLISKPTIEGRSGGPASAYQAAIDAWHTGDLDALRAVSTGETAERMSSPEVLADPVGTSRTLIAFAGAMFPQRIVIEQVDVDGDEATLTVQGETDQCMLPTERSVGTVQLVREEGSWRVGEESWESAVES